jgi:DNA polymerase-3 subunit beta
MTSGVSVLLESVGKDKIHLNATDLKVSIQCNLNVNLIKSGSITIPAKRLLQIIKELPDQPIHISVNSKNQININCGNIR